MSEPAYSRQFTVVSILRVNHRVLDNIVQDLPVSSAISLLSGVDDFGYLKVTRG